MPLEQHLIAGGCVRLDHLPFGVIGAEHGVGVEEPLAAIEDPQAGPGGG